MELINNDHVNNQREIDIDNALQVKLQRRYYRNGVKIVLIWMIAMVTCFFQAKFAYHHGWIADLITIPVVATLYLYYWKILKAILAHKHSIKIGHVSIGLVWIAWSGKPYVNPTGEFDCRILNNYSLTFKGDFQPWFGYHEEWYDGPFPSYTFCGISFNWMNRGYIVKVKETGQTYERI